LLDYNSHDGLQEWVNDYMKAYIDEGILVYYKTTEPTHYMRSHSRNMAFRLANSTILCNLDADNFLGKGFADFMLDEFSKNETIFYTNNCMVRDTFGRIIVRNNDFFSIRGYNETLHGYGYEDGDIQNRLMLKGLKPKSFENPEFYHSISHTNSERVSEEFRTKLLYEMYINYMNPYTSGILLLNKDYTWEEYTLVNNEQLYIFVKSSNMYDCFFDDKGRVVLLNDAKRGKWIDNNGMLYIQKDETEFQIQKNSTAFNFSDSLFYRVQDNELKAKIIILLSDAINYKEAIKQINNKSVINPNGFGKGVVCKNFNSSNKIILS